MKKIAQHEFTWERWGGRDFGLDLVMHYNAEDEQYVLYPQVYPLGYINSIDLPIRPRKKGISLLFRFKNHSDTYWIHCPEFGMESILAQGD